MQRYNIFNQIHKSLRVLLYDTATLISRTDFDDPSQYETINERLKEVMNSFDKHAAHENAMILPLLQEYEPGIVDAFEEDHKIDHALIQKLKGSLMALDHAVSPEAKKQLGVSLSHSFVEFMIFNLQHIAKEETVLNNLLWRYYSDEELVTVNKKLVATIPTEELNYSSIWMMKGLSNNEIIVWLRNAERNAPPHAFRSLFSTAEKELEQFRFRKILEGLTEGIMIAS
ncbi:MAG: hemerythrin domain-containing protein [Bacteroidota bacterium]